MKKSINGLGILFAFFAIMLAFAFKAPQSNVDGYYAFDPSIPGSNKWVSVNIADLNQTGGYLCNDPDPLVICTGQFDTPPDESSDMPDRNVQNGTYQDL